MKKKIKVGVIALAKEEEGGVFQYICSFLENVKNDIEKEYIVFINEESESYAKFIFEKRRISYNNSFFAKVARMAFLALGIRRKVFFSKDELTQFSDIDIFICPYISPYPHYYLKKKFIFTLHDMQERYLPGFFSLSERLRRSIINHRLSRAAHKILCESNYVKKDINKFLKVENDKIKVIAFPPTAEYLNFKINKRKLETIKRNYNLPDKYIFYPSQSWVHKNHIKLIEAFESIKDRYEDLHIIFSGSKKSNHKNIISAIKRFNLSDRIHHIGFVSKDELPYIYKMSNFVVMPSLFESISIPIYEAFSLKVPVISSNVFGLKEQVGNSALTFNPSNVRDLLRVIEVYLTNSKTRDEKAKLGHDLIKNFDYVKFSKDISTLTE